MHWSLMSTVSRVLVAATGAVLAAVIVLLAFGLSNAYLIVAALALVIASIYLHRRDMDRAIARQLQRDADDSDDSDGSADAAGHDADRAD